jgi:DNA-binding MarR family transcriptional regulator
VADKSDFFAAAPLRAIGDMALTGTDLRTLLAISFHDRRSLPRGKGRGCVASNATLALEVGTDITTISRSVSKLVKLGYVHKEPQPADKRKHALRVLFDGTDTWQSCQQSSDGTGAENEPHSREIVGNLANDRAEIVGDPANGKPEIVGSQISETPRKLPKIDPQEILLNRERDCVETRIDAVETAHLSGADNCQYDMSGIFEAASRSLSNKARNDDLPTSNIRLNKLLPANLLSLPLHAQLAKIERAFDRLGWDENRLVPDDAKAIGGYLTKIFDEHDGPASHRALRMLEKLETHADQEAAA